MKLNVKFMLLCIGVVIFGSMSSCGCDDAVDDAIDDLKDAADQATTITKEVEAITVPITVDMGDLPYPNIPDGGKDVKEEKEVTKIPSVQVPLADALGTALDLAGQGDTADTMEEKLEKLDKLYVGKVVYNIEENTVTQPGLSFYLAISDYDVDDETKAVPIITIPSIEPGEITETEMTIADEDIDPQGDILMSGEFRLYITPKFMIDTAKYPDPPEGKVDMKVTIYVMFVIKPLKGTI